ncbi:MAG: SRPBCC domain-containing protein [Saccharofermentanales bacterium]
MIKLHTYLNFDGNALEAMEFYKSIFGGEFSSLIHFKDFPMEGFTIPVESENKIMHMSLLLKNGDILMASDIVPSSGQKLTLGNEVYTFVDVDSKEEADRIFNGLSAGGFIEIPLEVQPWGDYYGSFKDKYNIWWMISNSPKALVKELVINRIFNAHRDLVWKAWTEPERVKEWWGPRTYTIPVANIDLRVGGRYLVCMRSSDGKDFWSTGIYQEIDPVSKLVMTDSFADENGNVVSASYYGMDPEFPLIGMLTVTFDDNYGMTKFSLKYDDVSKISSKDLADMQQGWVESFDKLDEYLMSLKAD